MQRVINRRLYNTRLLKVSARGFAAAIGAQRNQPLSDTIVNFRDKIDTLNTKLIEIEQDLFSKHEKLAAEQQKIVDVVEKAICRKGKSRMIKVGSLSNQLAVDVSSDIDLCFLPYDSQFSVDFHGFSDFRIMFMEIVKEQLERISQVDPNLSLETDISLLFNTRIPLLIVPLKNGTKIDIQFASEDYHSIRNTNLIRHYAAADVRFRQLYLWLRTLFIRLGIKKSKEGLLSSYHIILLVIHFLQAKTFKYLSGAYVTLTTPPVLPVLSKTHESAVGPEIPLDALLKLLEKPFDKLIDWKSENRRTAAELAIDLIDYYFKFNPLKNAISISKGCTFTKKQFPTATRLLLYDPYSSMSVAYSPLITDALTTAATYVKRRQSFGEFIDTFPEFPEATEFRYSADSKEFRAAVSSK